MVCWKDLDQAIRLLRKDKIGCSILTLLVVRTRAAHYAKARRGI